MYFHLVVSEVIPLFVYILISQAVGKNMKIGILMFIIFFFTVNHHFIIPVRAL